MKIWRGITAALAAIAMMVFVARAEETQPTPPPTQPAQPQPEAKGPSEEEVAAYKKWYDANDAKDIPSATSAANEYLKTFPVGQYVDYLKKWLAHLQTVAFNEAVKANNIAEMIRLGKEALAKNPDNLDVLYVVALKIARSEIGASPPSFAHAADAAEFGQRAIKLLEAGRTPSFAQKANWNLVLGQSYFTLGTIEEHNNNATTALALYQKVAMLDPASANAFLAIGRLRHKQYQTALEKFRAIPEADRAAPDPKPEVKAARDEVNAQADAVIEPWAHYLALTPVGAVGTGVRSDVEKNLIALYQYRHPDAADGLQKLIEQYRPAKPNEKPSADQPKPTASP